MFPDTIAPAVGLRLQAVAQHMEHILQQFELDPEFLALLQQALHLPNKLLSIPAAQGQPLRRQDRYLWSVPVIVTHAVVAGVADPQAPAMQWQAVVGMAAGAEYLGLATDLLDDIQDGDNAFIQHLGLPVALNCVMTLWEMAHAALNDAHLTIATQNCLLQELVAALIHAGNGQYLDIAYEQRQHVTVDEAMSMTTMKSGSLLSLLYASGAVIGATQTARSADEVELIAGTFATLGRHVGTLMQLANDAQDARQGTENPKSDRSRHKKTVPLVSEATFTPDVSEEGRERFTRLLIEQQRSQVMQILGQIATDYQMPTSWLRWLLDQA
jgi:geranylgeranyl pyrophosphate synthase